MRKPKILLMDEATASIDEKTDEIIQKVIAHDMPNTTVITIAHRLNTVMAYDKIMVLSEGKLVEEGSPLDLLEGRGVLNKGIFREMVEENGTQFFEKMRQVAAKKEAKR